ncbi:maleylpyruvate isomerase N-terminal domain-containing protein [Streptomyces bungoensis]|uniref:maleylpyruvate isomerase N-terminal domain-containing protein n=1 Tax=Streptomyces bungoensis TaxID=285568 RepID=UPI003CC62FA1
MASAPGPDAQVPTCPDRTLCDLVRHLGQGTRSRAATVTEGPATAPPAEPASEGPEAAPGEREALPAWSAASTRRLLDALPATSCTWRRATAPEVCGDSDGPHHVRQSCSGSPPSSTSTPPRAAPGASRSLPTAH